MSNSKNKIKNPALIVMQRELKSYFSGVIAYIVIGLFLLITGFFFFSVFFLNGRAELRNYFSLLPMILSFLIPALTMRLFAEENRSGSIETLLTLPVTEFQVVLGKYLASLISTLIMLAPTLFYVVTVAIFGTPDYGPIVGGFIGAIFLCAAFTSIGCFASAITKNQIVAWITGVLICFALTMLDSISFLMPPVVVKFINYLSTSYHFDSICKGILDSRDFIYLISVIVVFFTITVLLQKKGAKWSKNLKLDFSLFAVLILLGNIVSVNSFKKIDLTEEKTFSLSNASKTLIKNIDEPLTVRVFMDKNLPSQFAQVSQYVQDILKEYKAVGNKNFNVYFMDMSKEENIQMALKYGVDQVNDQYISNNSVSFKADFRGLAILYADNIEVINPINSSAGFEYIFTNKISKMINNNDVLNNLSENDKITVTLLLTDSVKKFDSASYEQIKQVVQESFDNVNKKQLGRMNLQVKDISDSEFEENKQKYGLQEIQVPVQLQNKTETVYKLSIGMIVSKKDDFRVLPVRFVQTPFGTIQLNGLENNEELITQGILSLLSKQVSIGYITGHGEHNLDDNKDGMPLKRLLGVNYQIQNIDITKEDIPFNINSIIINGPILEFSKEDLYKIDQFVMKGGNLLVFMDSGVENPMANYGGPLFTESPCNLNTFLESYGIKCDKEYVFDKRCAVNRESQDGNSNVYYIPVVQKDSMAKKHPVTQNLSNVMMFLNGPIDVSKAMENKNLKVTKLIQTSPQAWTKKVQETPIMGEYPPTSKEQMSTQTLAVLVEGIFNSAFTKDAEGVDSLNFINSSRLPGKIMVFSSSFNTTAGCIQGNGSAPVEHILLNAADYLNGNEEMCTMRTKGMGENMLNIKSEALAVVMQYFNIIGLPILVAVVCIVILILRKKRRIRIREFYNPNDERSIK